MHLIKIGKLIKDIKKATSLYEDSNLNVYWSLNIILRESMDSDCAEVNYEDIFSGDRATFEGTTKQQLFIRKEAMARLEKVNVHLKKLGFNSKVICQYGFRDNKEIWVCSPFIYVSFKGK